LEKGSSTPNTNKLCVSVVDPIQGKKDDKINLMNQKYEHLIYKNEILNYNYILNDNQELKDLRIKSKKQAYINP